MDTNVLVPGLCRCSRSDTYENERRCFSPSVSEEETATKGEDMGICFRAASWRTPLPPPGDPSF